MKTVPITPLATTAPTIHHASPLSTITPTLSAIIAHIMQIAVIFAFRGIGTSPSSHRRYGPKNRLRTSLSSSHGHDRVRKYDARIRKIVVGSPGRNTPAVPNPTQTTPIERYAHRTARSALLRTTPTLVSDDAIRAQP